MWLDHQFPHGLFCKRSVHSLTQLFDHSFTCFLTWLCVLPGTQDSELARQIHSPYSSAAPALGINKIPILLHPSSQISAEGPAQANVQRRGRPGYVGSCWRGGSEAGGPRPNLTSQALAGEANSYGGTRIQWGLGPYLAGKGSQVAMGRQWNGPTLSRPNM